MTHLFSTACSSKAMAWAAWLNAAWDRFGYIGSKEDLQHTFGCSPEAILSFNGQECFMLDQNAASAKEDTEAVNLEEAGAGVSLQMKDCEHSTNPIYDLPSNSDHSLHTLSLKEGQKLLDELKKQRDKGELSSSEYKKQKHMIKNQVKYI